MIITINYILTHVVIYTCQLMYYWTHVLISTHVLSRDTLDTCHTSGQVFHDTCDMLLSLQWSPDGSVTIQKYLAHFKIFTNSGDGSSQDCCSYAIISPVIVPLLCCHQTERHCQVLHRQVRGHSFPSDLMIRLTPILCNKVPLPQ